MEQNSLFASKKQKNNIVGNYSKSNDISVHNFSLNTWNFQISLGSWIWKMQCNVSVQFRISCDFLENFFIRPLAKWRSQIFLAEQIFENGCVDDVSQTDIRLGLHIFCLDILEIFSENNFKNSDHSKPARKSWKRQQRCVFKFTLDPST